MIPLNSWEVILHIPQVSFYQKTSSVRSPKMQLAITFLLAIASVMLANAAHLEPLPLYGWNACHRE
jgi:hypothetical protein